MRSREELRDHWVSGFLFGVSKDSTRRRQDLGKVGIGLLAGIFMLVMTSIAVWQGPRSGLPDKDDLVQVSGTIRSASQRKYDIRIALAETNDTYAFSTKAGADASLLGAITPGSNVTLWHEPVPMDYRAGTHTLEVFQLRVAGRMLWTYEQVERSWVSDNGVAVWLLVFSSIGVCYFIVYIWLAWP